MSIRLKILLSIVVTTFLTALVTGVISISSAKSLTDNAEKRFIIESNSTLQGYLKDLGSNVERAALIAAADHDLAFGLSEYLKTGERKKLRDAVLNIARYSDADILTITDAKGTVAMRSHQPDKFGDSNANLEHVKAAMAGNKTVAFESSANNPLALRCGTPIMYNGERIGVVSAGDNLSTEDFVDKMKSFTGAEVTMFLGDTRLMTTVLNAQGQRNVGTKASEKVSKQVLGGKDYMGVAVVAGKDMYTYYSPIRDASGGILGMTFVGMDISEQEHRLSQTITLVVAVLVFFCGLAAVMGLYISGNIAKPMAATVNMLHDIADGHLDTRLRLNLKDEIGAMANAMDRFADDLQNVVIGAMKKISEGDFNIKIEPKDSRDEIGNAIKNTVDSLRELIIEDGGRVLHAAADKDLTQRLDYHYKGEFAKMKDSINTVVDTLDAANSKISNSAMNLAEGSSQQASSLEEVSASLEEMSSMTKQTADNSDQAKLLASEARAAADEGDASMKRMAEAIRQIKTSADNTAKIVKSIDDIAFQTNLLALNAAVEAARAGEAGKGFAVVAEEVRNLAMRSAEAAKNTASMIEESVKNADGGVKITEEVVKSLAHIVDRISTVGGLITEIATASGEQALGIEQVNTAVMSITQVTMQLSAQASELSDMVSAFRLSESAGGGGGGGARVHAKRPLLPPPKSGSKAPALRKS